MFKIKNSKQKTSITLFLIAAIEMIILGGCATQIRKPARVCPGKESAAEALSLLRTQSGNVVPLKGGGQCLLWYYAGDGKLKKENFPVKLWVSPPAEIYMQGDVAFDPKGVVVGSNEGEFWLAVKLKEVSSFWWGQWSEGKYPEKLMISPKLVLEALGAVAVGRDEGWSLLNEKGVDILTKRQGGTEAKKIYVNTCDYLVRKIEYFDGEGRVAVIMELDKYKEISKNFFVPGVVKIINRLGSNKEDSVRITLGTVKTANFTDKQRKRLFVRPQPDGFKHIYKIVNGNVIEQPK